MPAIDSLLTRLATLEDYSTSVTAMSFLIATLESMQDPSIGDPIVPRGTDLSVYGKNVVLHLRASRNYYISHEMQKMATAGSEVLPSDAVVRRQSPPSDLGWLYFATPVTYVDIRAHLQRLHAVSWAVVGGGVTLTWWADKHDPIDSMNIQNRQRVGDKVYATLPRFQVSHIQRIVFGEELPQSVVFGKGAVIPPDLKVDVIQDREKGTLAWSWPEGYAPDQMAPRVGPDPLSRLVTVVWRLMRQTIVHVREDDQKVPKHLRRTVEKYKTDSKVSVITLRKREYHGTGEREWKMDHRVLVDGYWRLQWFGPKSDQWSDYIYIDPYIRGPEGTPLVVKDKIGSLVR